MSEPLLALEKLQVAYGGIQAVKGIDLEVGEGELVCLIGANGAGKTTTLKDTCGLLPVKAGKIRYAGKDINGKPSFQLVQRGLAMVPEGRGVFGALTIEENLAMGVHQERRRWHQGGHRASISCFRARSAAANGGNAVRRRADARWTGDDVAPEIAARRAVDGPAPLMVQKVFETIVTISGEGARSCSSSRTRSSRSKSAVAAMDGVRRDHARRRGEIAAAQSRVREAYLARRSRTRAAPASIHRRDTRTATRGTVIARAACGAGQARAEWFAEAMRLWKVARGCSAILVVLVSVVFSPVPVAGFVAVYVIAPLLGTGLLYASLAADRGDRPRVAHLVAVFAAPWRAQLAVVAAGLAVGVAENLAAWYFANINLLLPLGDTADIPAAAIVAINVTGVLASLPVTFVPMAALFDGESIRRAFSLSARALAMNVPALALLAGISLVMLLSVHLRGWPLNGGDAMLRALALAAASYAAWKDIRSAQRWRVDDSLVRSRAHAVGRHSKWRSDSSGSASTTSTALTRASGGPRRAHSRYRATASGAP